MTDKFKQPSGVRDTLPAECAAKRAIEQKLLSKFGQYGYLQIDTPALEYGGLYSEGDRFDVWGVVTYVIHRVHRRAR